MKSKVTGFLQKKNSKRRLFTTKFISLESLNFHLFFTFDDLLDPHDELLYARVRPLGPSTRLGSGDSECRYCFDSVFNVK